MNARITKTNVLCTCLLAGSLSMNANAQDLFNYFHSDESARVNGLFSSESAQTHEDYEVELGWAHYSLVDPVGMFEATGMGTGTMNITIQHGVPRLRKRFSQKLSENSEFTLSVRLQLVSDTDSEGIELYEHTSTYHIYRVYVRHSRLVDSSVAVSASISGCVIDTNRVRIISPGGDIIDRARSEGVDGCGSVQAEAAINILGLK